MEYLLYICRFLYRIRWWIIVLPLLVAIIAIFSTRSLSLTYDVNATIYTGIISGYNIESSSGVTVSQPSNSMDNLLNIITSQGTLKNTAIRLYTQCMIYGDPDMDNNHISASTYRELLRITPKEVQSIIDKTSEEKTMKALLAFERPSRDNFIYILLNNENPYFSTNALLEKIKVTRMGASDMIKIEYSANDPGIAYNTLVVLNEEFMSQYQNLRFGETDNVIKFFEAELEKLGAILKTQEDSLIMYNIDKRIINYPEQTKQITILDAGHQMKLQQLLLDYKSTKALADFFEQKLGNQAKRLRSNSNFIAKLGKISELSSKVSSLELVDDKSTHENDTEIKKYKKKLTDAENDFTELSESLSISKSSTENVSSENLVTQWLEQVVLTEKTKAEMEAMDIERGKLNEEFEYYSPIGSTLKRKERSIGFIESTYMSMLSSLNAARLRQKNLQMTSATLRVMSPPTYPLNAQPTKAKMIILTCYLATLIFILGYFLLLELLDRTLRDKIRAERITGGKVIGAFPGETSLQYRRYSKTIQLMAIKVLSNHLLPYCNQGELNVINLISTEQEDGKSYIGNALVEYWNSIGLNVKKITYEQDFQIEDKAYILAQSIEEIHTRDNQKEDILIVEYPSLHDSSIPPALLLEAKVNLIIARANRAWKGTDQMSYDKLKKVVNDKNPILTYLNKAGRDEVEGFTGQLPPFTKIKNLIYRFSQLGLTSV